MYYIFHGESIALICFISLTHCRHRPANENDPGETEESYTGPYDLVLLHLEAKLDLGGSFYMLVLTPLVSLDDHSATRPSDPTNMSAFPEQWAVANNGDGGLRRHGRPGVHRRQLFSNPVQLKHWNLWLYMFFIVAKSSFFVNFLFRIGFITFFNRIVPQVTEK